MTALEGLDRLEAPGLWRASRDEQRRDVYVSVGDAELVIEDKSGTALSHWSLPALSRQNPGQTPALYAPAIGSDEQLEIDEPEMIAALDRVVNAVEKGRRRPGALRRLTTGLLLGFFVGLVALWLPGAMRKQAASIIPNAQRMEIGTLIQAELMGLTGPACTNPTGMEALRQLQRRLFPTNPIEIAVHRDLPQPTLALPGGLVLVSDRVLVSQDDPDVAAGHILAAFLTARTASPLEAFLDEMSFLNLSRMMATGTVPQAAIEEHVEWLILTMPEAAPIETLRRGFDAARVAWEPYALATGKPVGDTPPSRMPPAMDDTPWQALREICAG